jgi:hypothetical protein
MPEADGFDALFSDIRGSRRPGSAQAVNAITSLLDGRACRHRISEALQRHSSPQLGWPMAYALSWISVAGGDSVMPPWVRKQFKEASWIVRDLRDQACVDSGCHWCRERNDPKRALSRWFGFDGFRPEPRDAAGRPLLIARCIGCWSRNFLQLFAFYVLSVAQLLGGCIKLTPTMILSTFRALNRPKQALPGSTLSTFCQLAESATRWKSTTKLTEVYIKLTKTTPKPLFCLRCGILIFCSASQTALDLTLRRFEWVAGNKNLACDSIDRNVQCP